MSFKNRYYTGCGKKEVTTKVDKDGVEITNKCPVDTGVVFRRDCASSQTSDSSVRQREALNTARAARDYFTDVLGCASCDIALNHVDETHYSD